MRTRLVKELLRLLESVTNLQIEGEIIIKVKNGKPSIESVKERPSFLKLIKNGRSCGRTEEG